MLVRMGAPTRRFHVLSAVRPSPARIEPERARDLRRAGAVVIDVRRHDDASASPSGALRISPDMIPQRAETLRRDVAIVLACT
jgi:rhodanese-related sulfurtransferase